MELVLKSIIYIGLVAISQSHDLKDFESSVLYNIEWPGPSLGKTFEEFVSSFCLFVMFMPC